MLSSLFFMDLSIEIGQVWFWNVIIWSMKIYRYRGGAFRSSWVSIIRFQLFTFIHGGLVLAYGAGYECKSVPRPHWAMESSWGKLQEGMYQLERLGKWEESTAQCA
jgi:hypothetical protein